MDIEIQKKGFSFINSCYSNRPLGYKLTPNSEVTPYGLVFAIFNFKLFGKTEYLKKNKNNFANLLIKNINNFKKERILIKDNLIYDKPYLQMLTFTLSCLSILNEISSNPLEDHTNNLFSKIETSDYLENIKAFEGKPGSGNFSMFFCIIEIHNSLFFKSSKKKINEWVKLHIKNMNKNGFWGKDSQNPYIQFQNGYHQYEIFDYLNIGGDFWGKAGDFVSSIADNQGNFSPYPGGSGCYNYDAIFFLTSRFVDNEKYNEILLRLYEFTIKDINSDGGFSESNLFRPYNLRRIKYLISFLFKNNKKLILPKLYFLKTFLNPKNSKINNNWTVYKREWDESDLWNTWFKNLTLLKIGYLSKLLTDDLFYKRFINYPGIGYHHKNSNES